MNNDKLGFSTGNFILDGAINHLLGPDGEQDCEDLLIAGSKIETSVDGAKMVSYLADLPFVTDKAKFIEGMSQFLILSKKLKDKLSKE